MVHCSRHHRAQWLSRLSAALPAKLPACSTTGLTNLVAALPALAAGADNLPAALDVAYQAQALLDAYAAAAAQQEAEAAGYYEGQGVEQTVLA